MTIFVTGSTGFLGRYIVEGLLQEGEDVVLLVRGRSSEHARERARESLAWFETGSETLIGSRVTVCRGDLGSPGLGLSPEDRELVLDRCDSFLHCGASVRFDLPMEEARSINVGGTAALLELARERQRRGPLHRVDHVSTCYVAGRRQDLVREHELDASAGHRNSYERSKYECELLVREAGGEIPFAILRPSIVVGESGFGRTSNFNTLYWPVRIYASGYWRTLPGRPAAPLDVVPVDFVRDAVLALRRRPETLGRTFHLAAGPDRSITIGDAMRLVEEAFPERRPIRVVDPAWWMRGPHPVLRSVSFGRLKRFLGTLESYVPYFLGNPVFDNSATLTELDGTGIEPISVEDYFGRLVSYCVETDWGRRDRPKPSATPRVDD